tara:strand:- start:2869 stop:3405 length:537 start_codon:yes stop_codon:yes gene_type:complete
MLARELNKFGEQLVRNTKKNLKAKGKSISGALADSIRYELMSNDKGWVLEFWMLEYGYYQDEGVKGFKPESIKVNGKTGKQKSPNSRFRFGSGKGKGSLFKSIDKWIVRKGLDERKNGKFTSRDSIRYAMTKSIFHQGIEASHFFTEAWDKTTQNIDEKLADAVLEDVEKLYFELINE